MNDQRAGTGTAVSLTWDAPGGLVLLSLKIFFLRILTAGIYHFWGKTEVRRKIWSSVRLQNQPLLYAGTGWELFLGFVIVIFVFVLPVYAGVIAAVIFFGENSPISSLIQTVFVGALFYLVGVAQYRARRYRLSRTNWRGIRGHLEGSSWGYGWKYFLSGIAIPLTLGWIVPWRDTLLTRTLTRETRFGTMPLQFDGSAAPLFAPFAVLWFGTILIYAGAGTVIYLLFGNELLSQVQTNAPPSPMTVLGIVAVFFVGIVLFAIVSAWYESKKLNYFAARTSIDQARFRLETTPVSLIALLLTNLAIVLLSLGMFTPIAQARIAGYFVGRMGIDGTINFEAIAQSEAALSKTGEGLAEAFDIDAF